MPGLSAYASVLCTIATLSSAQHPHFHQWNHNGPAGAALPSSTASIAPSSTVSVSTPSVAVAELDSSPISSIVVAGSASSSTSSIAANSAVSGTGSSSGATSSSSISPNGIKAGVAGFPQIQITNKAALAQYADYISWYSDYWPNTTDFVSGTKTVKGIGMVSPPDFMSSFAAAYQILPHHSVQARNTNRPSALGQRRLERNGRYRPHR